MLDDECFAVQEPVGEAPHLDTRPSIVGGRAQPVHHLARDAVVVVGETGQIALRGDPSVEPLKRGLDSGWVEQAVVGWFGLGSEQQPHLVVVAEAFCDHVEPGRVDVRRCYGRSRWVFERRCGGGEHLVDSISDPQPQVRAVGGEHRASTPKILSQQHRRGSLNRQRSCGVERQREIGHRWRRVRVGCVGDRTGFAADAHRVFPAGWAIRGMADRTASRRASHCPGLAKVS